MTARRVLMVSQHKFPSHQLEPPFPGHPTLCRNVMELLASGIGVDLVAITPRFSFGRRPPEAIFPPSAGGGLRVYGMPMRARRTPAIWYLLQYLAFLVWALLSVSILALRRRYDAVQVDTLPDLLVFSTIVPRLRRMPIVLYVYDLMPEMTAARLSVSFEAFPVRLVAWLERAATNWADVVISVTALHRRHMASRGLDPAKVVLVANSHPLGELPPRVRPRSPTLILPTTLIERYGAQVAIRAMAELRPNWPSLTLQILGAGEYRGTLIALAAELGLSDAVHFSQGFLPWRQAMEQVRRASIGIVPIVEDGYGDLILPNKVFEFAFMEIPFACSRLCGIAEHLPPDAVAYFEPGDAAGLAAQLHRLLSDPRAAAAQAARAKEALADLSWENASKQYLRALGYRPRSISPSPSGGEQTLSPSPAGGAQGGGFELGQPVSG